MLNNRQSGFTLIELIIVIVILGILSIVAAPRFIDVSSDALSAQLNSIKASLKGANSLIYGKAVIAGTEKLTSGSVSALNSTISTTVGYITPTAANVILTLDGSYEIMVNGNDDITADWGIYNLPPVGLSIYIIPKGYTTLDSCYFLYNVTATNTSAPTYYYVGDSGC